MLESSSLFKNLPPPTLSRLNAACVKRRLAAEETLFRKGDAGNALYCLTSGRLRIHSTAADGRDIIVNILQAGDICGEIALIDGQPRTADATAMEPTDLLMLDRSDFLRMTREDGELALHLLQLVCQRLRWLSSQIEDATFLSVSTRLAKRLVALAEQHGESDPEGIRITLKLSQEAIGELVGASRETTNKQLRAWEKAGWIALRRQTVIIRNLALLRRYSEAELGDLV